VIITIVMVVTIIIAIHYMHVAARNRRGSARQWHRLITRCSNFSIQLLSTFTSSIDMQQLFLALILTTTGGDIKINPQGRP